MNKRRPTANGDRNSQLPGGGSIRSRRRSIQFKLAQASKVPADPTQWSESSKGVLVLVSAPTDYTDINYSCRKCGKIETFTAADQRYTYEVRKAYISQQRVLCIECFRIRTKIEHSLRSCRQSWKSDRRSLRGDTVFLRRWLELLQEHVELGGKSDEANIKMLTMLLRNPEA